MLNEFSGFKSRRPKGPFEEFESAPPEGDMGMAPGGDMGAPMMSGEELAAMGNFTDDSVGHLSSGEIVIPVEALKPELLMQLEKSFQDAGLDLNSYIVGSGQEHVNEKTGMPEFAAQPGVGPGAKGRGGRLARIQSRYAELQKQREAMQPQQPTAAAPAADGAYDGRDRAFGAGGGDPFAKLQARIRAGAAAQQQPSAAPYQVPLLPAVAAPTAPAQRQYVGNVAVLSPEEDAYGTITDAAKFPDAYRDNPRLAARLAEAQRLMGQAPAAPQAPMQQAIRTTQAPAAPAEAVDNAGMDGRSRTMQASPVQMSQPKAAQPIGGMEQMYADFAGKKQKAQQQQSAAALAGVSQNESSKLSSVSSASAPESTPSTKDTTTSDSTGTSAEDPSKTNRLSDVSSSSDF